MTEATHRARLACFMHAASVNPEPGSNSPKKRRMTLISSRAGAKSDVEQRGPAPPPKRTRAFAESRLHSSNVKVPSTRRHPEVLQRPPPGVPAGKWRSLGAAEPRRQVAVCRWTIPSSRGVTAHIPSLASGVHPPRIVLDAAKTHSERRPAKARATVSSSAYWRSAPAGSPWANRVTRTPRDVNCSPR